MRLLLIEDDPMIGAGVQQALQREGYAIDWLQDATAALGAAVGVGVAAVAHADRERFELPRARGGEPPATGDQGRR